MKRPPSQEFTEDSPLLTERLSKLAECIPSLPSFSNFRPWVRERGITISDIVLAVAAVGFACASTAVFWPSSVTFSTIPLGQWLSNHVLNSAVLCFISSAPDLLLLTALLTIVAWPYFMKVYSAQNDPLAKASFVVAVTIFTAIQALQGPAVTYGTGGSRNEIILAGLGGLPGAFFAATINVAEYSFSFGRALKSAYLTASEYLLETIIGTIEKYHVQRELIRLHAELIRRLHAGNSALLASQTRINLACLNGEKAITDKQQILGVWEELTKTLDADQKYDTQESWLRYLSRNAVLGIGLFATAILCLGFILNMIHIMPKILPINDTMSDVFGTALSLAATFIFLYINGGGMSSAFNSLVNMLSGKPVENTLYQLHPKATVILATFALVWNWLSWYTSYNLVNKNIPDQWSVKPAFLITVIPTIIFYHVVGCMKFMNEIVIKKARNGDESKLAPIIQSEGVEKAHKISPQAAIQLVASLPDESVRQKLLGKNADAALQQLKRSTAWNTSRRDIAVEELAADLDSVARQRELQPA